MKVTSQSELRQVNADTKDMTALPLRMADERKR